MTSETTLRAQCAARLLRPLHRHASKRRSKRSASLGVPASPSVQPIPPRASGSINALRRLLTARDTENALQTYGKSSATRSWPRQIVLQIALLGYALALAEIHAGAIGVTRWTIVVMMVTVVATVVRLLKRQSDGLVFNLNRAAYTRSRVSSTVAGLIDSSSWNCDAPRGSGPLWRWFCAV
jgi:hypothetical protein